MALLNKIFSSVIANPILLFPLKKTNKQENSCHFYWLWTIL